MEELSLVRMLLYGAPSGGLFSLYCFEIMQIHLLYVIYNNFFSYKFILDKEY